jgi:hypothetical protein
MDKKGFEARHAASVSLAQDISGHLHEDHPLPMSDVYSELLYSALDAVDYLAIARELLRGFFKDAAESSDKAEPADEFGPMCYETYTAFLWATADGQAAAHWFDTARSCHEEAQREPASKEGTAGAAYFFAQRLRNQLPGIITDGTSPVQSTLIDCALSRVNWQVLAAELLRVYGVGDADEVPSHPATPELSEASEEK